MSFSNNNKTEWEVVFEAQYQEFIRSAVEASLVTMIRRCGEKYGFDVDAEIQEFVASTTVVFPPKAPKEVREKAVKESGDGVEVSEKKKRTRKPKGENKKKAVKDMTPEEKEQLKAERKRAKEEEFNKLPEEDQERLKAEAKEKRDKRINALTSSAKARKEERDAKKKAEEDAKIQALVDAKLAELTGKKIEPVAEDDDEDEDDEDDEDDEYDDDDDNKSVMSNMTRITEMNSQQLIDEDDYSEDEE
jgi:hypothetical protein